MENLDTTNLLLGIMAAVSVLEALLLIGMGIGGFVMYRRLMQLAGDLEARQIAPLREKVDGILADVKTVTARVSHQTERVDDAISGTIHRVDETADRVKGSVRDKVSQAIGVVRGVRAVITSIVNSNSSHDPTVSASGHVSQAERPA
jgi:hypothetical protein